jgi:hypothetical protein
MDANLIVAAIWAALNEASHNICKNKNVKANTRKYRCKVARCQRNGYAHGYCNAHYIRYKKGKALNTPILNGRYSDAANVKCVACGEPIGNKGGLERCAKHFKSARTRIIKSAIVKLFGDKCGICGRSYNVCIYDFHHTNMSEKERSAAYLIANCSVVSIAKEVSKCEVICSNCHRAVHNEG